MLRSSCSDLRTRPMKLLSKAIFLIMGGLSAVDKTMNPRVAVSIPLDPPLIRSFG